MEMSREQKEWVGQTLERAAAITSCGLIELAKLTKGRQSGIYLGAAMKLDGRGLFIW